jgi:flagellar motility protein MotE (MotC chaperone)
MTMSDLDRVIEEIKALTPDEQRQLREVLDDSVTEEQSLRRGALEQKLEELQRKRKELVEELEHLEAERERGLQESKGFASLLEEEFEQRLLAKGIISEIPPRIIDPLFEQNRKPVEIEGKPVSEIIIEERR